MHPNTKLCLKIFACSISLFLYCEFFIYFIILGGCDWPKIDPTLADDSPKVNDYEPTKVMFLADTHLLGSRNGHWFDKLRREWQMHRAFQTAMTLHKPDLVFVLGDVTDEGHFCTDREFNYYVKRFYKLFQVPEETKLYVVAGNHDIGFHYKMSAYLNHRFQKAFNSTGVQLVTEKGNHFVLINSMAFEGDGCFLCESAEKELAKLSRIFECTKNANKTHNKCDPKVNLNLYSRPVLLQHFPLYRPSDKECDDFDAAPEPLKSQQFIEKWDSLGEKATMQILTQLKPRLALSGHTHHGCTRKLPIGNGLEITLPSFSWRNKNSPNYGLAVFTPDNYAFVKCEMPREYTVILLYMCGLTSMFVWLVYTALRKRPRYRMKLR